MTKFFKVLKLLTDKRFLMSIMTLIAITVPITSRWLDVNSVALTGSIAGIATTLAVVFALFIDSPAQKDNRLKGGKK